LLGGVGALMRKGSLTARAESRQESDPEGGAQIQSSIYTCDFWLIFAATCVLNLAANILLLFPLFVVKLGGGASTIGAIIAVGSAAALVVRPWVGSAIHRYGRRNIALWMFAADTAIILLYIPLNHIGWAIYAVRIVHGAVEGTARVALFTMVYDILPEGRQGEAMATFSLSGMGPASLGALLGEIVLQRFGFGAFFVAASFLLGIGAAGVGLIPHETARKTEDAVASSAPKCPGYLELLTGSPLMMLWILALLFGLSNSVRGSFVAPFAYQVGIHSVGVYFTVYAGVAVLLRLRGARILDRVGIERVLAPSFLLLAIGIAMVAGSSSPAMLDIAAVIGGLGHGFAYPATSALIIRHTPAGGSARSSTIYTSLWDFSAMAGPFLFGWTARIWGYSPMFLMAGGLSLIATIYVAAGRSEIPSATKAARFA
jgi:MFS family permease